MTTSRIVAIDPNDPTPPYAQLHRQIATMIEAAVLDPGERLPSVRQLAGDLGLAPGTVMHAYRELEVTGHVSGDGRRGTTVAHRSDSPTPVVEDALQALARQFYDRAASTGADATGILAAVMAVVTERRRTAQLPARR